MRSFPSKTVMGSGPFVFVEHQAGAHWIGKRFDKYFDKGKPYLDGFRAVFIKSSAVVTALQGGQIQAEFRSISPGERTQLEAALKDRIVVQEAPWVCKVDLIFNTEAAPFDKLEGAPGAVDGDRPLGRLERAVQDHHRQAGRRAAAAGLHRGAHRQ